MFISKKLKGWVGTLLIVFFVVLLGIGLDKGPNLYTYFWHLNNSEPIQWNSLKIKVPAKLIAEQYSDDDFKNRLKVFLPMSPKKVSIFFSPSSTSLDNLSFEKGLKDIGYKILEKKTCIYSGQSCLWLKSTRSKDNSSPENVFVEDIYFEKFDFRISYFGLPSHRHLLLEIVENIEFEFHGKGTKNKV